MKTIYWINLYQQGWYHRAGKPGTLPFHPGDVYASWADAVADIDKEAPYVGTVALEVPNVMLPQALRVPYAASSEPVSLRFTRQELGREKRRLTGFEARAAAVEEAEVSDLDPPLWGVGD